MVKPLNATANHKKCNGWFENWTKIFYNLLSIKRDLEGVTFKKLKRKRINRTRIVQIQKAKNRNTLIFICVTVF